MDANGNRVTEGDQIEVGLNYLALSRKEFELDKVSPIANEADE